MKPKEKANELVTMHHNLIQDIGGELGQEILVTILAKQCALILVDEIIKSNPHITPIIYGVPAHSTMEYWQEVRQEIENL